MVLKKALPLFLLFTLLLSSGRITSYDAGLRYFIAKHFLETGSIVVKEKTPETSEMIYIPEKQGWVSYFGLGQSLVFLPFAFLGSFFKKGSVAEFLPLIFIYAPLVGVLWYFFSIKVLGSLGVELKESVKWTTVFFTSTTALLYVSQSLQEEALIGLFGTLSLYFLIKGGKCLPWCGFFLGLAILTRPIAIVFLFPLLGYFIRQERLKTGTLSKIAKTAMGGIVPGLLFLGFNYVRFGSVVADAYTLYCEQRQLVMWKPFDWRVFSALFIGLGKGFIPLSPILILSFLGIGNGIKRKDPFAIGTLIGFFAILFILSRKMFDPDGSECWGVRYLVGYSTFLLYFLRKGYEDIRAFVLCRYTTYILIILGISFQLAGSFMPDTIEYTQENEAGLRLHFLSHPTEGQLGKRIRNISSFFRNGTVELPSGLTHPTFYETVQRYVPNYWWIVYLKRLA